MIARHLSTNDQLPHRRAEVFQAQMNSLFAVGVAVKPSALEPLQTRMQAFTGESLHFASLHFSPHKTTSVSARTGARSRMLVTIQQEGIAQFQQGGRVATLQPGQFVIIDPERPFTIETGDIVTRSIYVNPDQLRQRVPQMEKLTGIAINGREGTGALFRTFVDQVFALGSTMDRDVEARVAAVLPDMLAIALNALPEARITVASPARRRHDQRIRRFVRENLADPQLNSHMIAEGVGLSERYVHELFSTEACTLMRWVWAERLQRCSEQLGTPSLKCRSISSIAYSWGFNDVAHFSRAFRNRYHTSPREFRKKALA